MVVAATHPIQHFCPQYASLSAVPGVDLTVVFHSLRGVESYHDEGFGAEVTWGAHLLDGYDSVHLAGSSLGRELARLSPDWLVIYGYASPMARHAWWWAMRNPKTKVAYVADSEFRHRAPTSLASRVKRVGLRLLFRRVTTFLTVGTANEDYYRVHGVPEEKLVRMNFPIDPSLNFDPRRAAELREELGIAPDAMVILNVGKFEARKRQQVLIEATADLPGIHLLLAGTGAELDACREAAAGRHDVTFLGFVAPEDLAPCYALADVYVHPSTYDPHPLAVSEAAAAGCVCVVSDKTGSWGQLDDVVPGRTGVVVPSNDVKAWTQALSDLADDRPRAAAMGEAARKDSAVHQDRAHGGFIGDLV